VIVKLEPIVSAKDFDVDRPPTVTEILKLKVPLVVGLPLNAFPLSCSPGGGLSIDQVAGPGGPSEALNVTE
jgi:hypothetical protein